MRGLPIIAAIAALFVLSSCNNNQSTEAEVAQKEQQYSDTDSNTASTVVAALPSFAIQDVNGTVINLQNFKGKKLFVNLWASWCPPCKREMPSIEKLYKDTDSSRVKFLLVSLDDQFEAARNYVTSKKLNLPIYYPAENPPALFQVQGIPATFIFNENGDLIKRVDGGANYDTREYRTLLQ